jgi:hypothetical protein
MLKRLKQTLVESFVGAVALGYLLAQSVLHFVSIFTTPLTSWVMRNEFMPRSVTKAFSLKDALPGLFEFVLLTLIWYVLMRWLYFKPLRTASNDPGSNPEIASS